MPGPKKRYEIRFGDLRMTADMLAKIDQRRGELSRAEYIRQAINAALKKKLPKSKD